MVRNYISTTTMDIEVFNYLKFKNIDNNVCLRCVRTVQTKHINDFPESYLDLSIPERLDFIHSLCGNEYFRKNLEKNIIKQKTSPYSYKSESKSRFKKEYDPLKEIKKRTSATSNRYRETSAAWGL